MRQYYPEFDWEQRKQSGVELKNQLVGGGRPLAAGQSASSSAIRRIARGGGAAATSPLEFLRDMMRAIGIPRRDPDRITPFGPCLCSLVDQANWRQRRIVVHHARLAPG